MCFICLQGNFGIQMQFEYVSSFGTHPLWIRVKLEMKTYFDMLYMPIREIQDSDAIRVGSEFRDISFIDSYQIKYEPLI